MLYSINEETLPNWRKQVERHNAGIKTVRATAQQKLEAVTQIRNGQLTVDQVVERFRLRSRQMVSAWMKQFSLAAPKEPDKANSDTVNALKEAKKRAEDAELRIIALETLITEAERELGVSIRKKSGSGQPKK